MKRLIDVDPEIAEVIRLETERQATHLELIASENFVSAAVMEAAGSTLTNKYAEGYPGRRYYGGCEFVDVAENLAIERAKKLFGCEHANVQPHSGSQANMGAYLAVLEIGDKILGLSVETPEQVNQEAMETADYLAVSPVFLTPTKDELKSAWGLDGVRRIRSMTDLPLVAIGSIKMENARQVIEAGADCVAVVSAIVSAEDPEQATRMLVAEVRAAKAARRA